MTLIYAAIAVAGNTTPSDTEADTSEEAATAASVTTTDPVPTSDQPTTGVADPPAPATTRPPSTTQVPTTQEATTTRPPTTTTVPEAERDGDSANPGDIYPGRPDIQDDDHERQLGAEPVRFAGFSVSVLSAEYVERASDYQCCGYLRVRVRILNRDDEQQSWSRLDFSLARPSGEVYSPTVVVGPDDQLGLSGSLVHGGVAEGDLWFSVDPDATGDYFIYWEPSYKPYETDRGIWRFTR